jgi:hypothetical protein
MILAKEKQQKTCRLLHGQLLLLVFYQQIYVQSTNWKVMKMAAVIRH